MVTKKLKSIHDTSVFAKSPTVTKLEHTEPNMYSPRQNLIISSAFAILLSIQIAVCLGDYVRCRRPRNCSMQIAQNDEWWPTIAAGHLTRKSKLIHIESEDSRGKYIRSKHFGRLPNHYTNLPGDGRVQVKSVQKNVMEKRDTDPSAINRSSRVDRLFNEPVPGDMLFPPKVMLFRAQPSYTYRKTTTDRSPQFGPILHSPKIRPRPTKPMSKAPKLYPFYEHEAITDHDLFSDKRSQHLLTTVADHKSKTKDNIKLRNKENPSVQSDNTPNQQNYFPTIVYANSVNTSDQQVEKPGKEYEMSSEEYSHSRPIEYVNPTKMYKSSKAEYENNPLPHKSTDKQIQKTTIAYTPPVTRSTIEELLDELMLTIPKKVNYHHMPGTKNHTEPSYRHHIGSMNDDGGILVPVTTKLYAKHPVFIEQSPDANGSIGVSNQQWIEPHPDAIVYQPTPRSIKKSMFATVGHTIPAIYSIDRNSDRGDQATTERLNSFDSQSTNHFEISPFSTQKPSKVPPESYKDLTVQANRIAKRISNNYVRNARRKPRRNRGQQRRPEVDGTKTNNKYEKGQQPSTDLWNIITPRKK